MNKKEENTKLNFEESMQQLEKIANELEDGKITLEESVTKFEEGMKLSKECNDLLENAEKKITILLKKDDKIEENNFIAED